MPRFRGGAAPLAALAAKVRSAATSLEKASSAGRLARQLARRGIEVREAISLAEKSLALSPDVELSLDLASWWVESGDLIRGAAMAQRAAPDLPLERRTDTLLLAARLYARAGQIPQTTQALRQASQSASQDPRSLEMHGSLGFWTDIPAADCARSYLRAAELRTQAGEEGPALEALLRAFEVAPNYRPAADALADLLRKRGRSGAADEIIREHLRRGSAAQRAAHHEREFYAALDNRDFGRAFESALEAELDLDLDPERLEMALEIRDGHSPEEFETFIVSLARDGLLGDGASFGAWLLALIQAHTFDWGQERVQALLLLTSKQLGVAVPEQPDVSGSERMLRDLRERLGSEDARELQAELRPRISYLECERGAWGDAFEVIQPLLTGKGQASLGLSEAAFALIVSGRSRNALGRARSLSQLANYLPEAAAAVAQAVAAEMLLSQGLPEEARAAAERAVTAGPASERAVASQALVALSSPGSASAGLLERSLSVLVARADACALLCRSAAERGSHRLALTWAARAFALRPGDKEAAQALLLQAQRAEDPEKLMESLLSVLAQAAPCARLSPEIAEAVSHLRTLDASLVFEIGSKVLAATGVRNPEVVAALTDLARSTLCPRLQAAITERQLVAVGPAERVALTLGLARHRLSAGENMAAARALRRALSLGADVTLVEACLEDLGEEMDPDGKLSILEIEAELLEKSEASALKRADALRVVGAARWDLATDSAGAVSFWLKAADLDPERGLELFAHYLHHFAGGEVAVQLLKEAASQTEDARRSGRLLGYAARELFEQDKREEAFTVSKLALERAPLLTELLSIAEVCASPEQTEELLGLYDLLARSTLGTFGERAVHYRAARKLEERGLPERALEHACAAFEAVPAEGVAFVLMARLAESTAGHGALVTSLQKVADAATSDQERARWMAKAAELADTESVGRRQRVDILLRAAQLLPEQKTITSLLDALAHYLADEPDSWDEMWEKFEVLASEALRYATGAHGAQLCLSFGAAAVSHFDKPHFALARLSQAVSLDIEVPDFENLLPFANQLAGVPEKAGEFLEITRARAAEASAPLGRGLARLAGRVAELLGEAQVEAELLVQAATDFPEDAQLVALARASAQKAGREDLLELVEGLLPVVERAKAVLARLPSLAAEEGLEALLELELEVAPEEMRVRLLEEIGERQEHLGYDTEAGQTFRSLLELSPHHPVALRGVERDADRTGAYEELARILKLRTSLTEEPGEARRLSLRRAAVLETKLGRAKEARDLLSEMVDQTRDRAALRMLADSWERTGDFAEAAEKWIRVKDIAEDDSEADDAAYRASVCLVESGVPRRASEVLRQLKKPNVVQRKLSLEVARQLGDKEEVRKQLVGLAEAAVGDGREIGELYLEAAQLALEAGDDVQAQLCASRARAALPSSSEARLLSARLKQKLTPIKSEAEAREMLLELSELQALSSAQEREIVVYLRSQALRVADSDEAAKAMLEEALEEQGPRGLLCLALAELSLDDGPRALSLFESAVGAELYGFRAEGEILLQAGRLARQVGDYARARGFISAVADEDPSRARAAKELEELALEQARAKREAREQRQAEKLAEAKAQEAAARKAAELKAAEQAAAEQAAAEQAAAEQAAAEQANQQEGADQAAEAGVDVASAGESQEALRKQREALREAARREHREATKRASEHADLAIPARSLKPRPTRSQVPPRTANPRSIASQPPEVLLGAVVQAFGEHKAPDLEEEMRLIGDLEPIVPGSPDSENFLEPVVPAAPDSDESQPERGLQLEPSRFPAPAPVIPSPLRAESRSPSSGPVSSLKGERVEQTERTESVLVDALEKGDILAGRELLDRMLVDKSRSRDAVVVAQHLAALDPGDAGLLGLLVTAAARDRNEALALAVRHVLGAYGAGDPVSAPALDELRNQGEGIQSLLAQGATSPLHEVLSMVWEYAQSLYKKDLSEYGISGVERVPLHSPTPLGLMYRDVARILGMTRTAVFRQKGQDDIAMQVALLSPPAVIVSGSIQETSSELCFHFAAMLAAAAPEHALLYGTRPDDIQRVLQAISLCFGDGGETHGQRPDPEVSRLASFFWETIPARAQRRITYLCKDAPINYSALTDSSRRVLRRAGLIASADLATAVDTACLDFGMTPPTTLRELAHCARQSDAVADLLGLALSPEYAEVRFRRSS